MGGKVKTKTNLSPARASLLGLSLAIMPRIMATLLACWRTHSARTNWQETTQFGNTALLAGTFTAIVMCVILFTVYIIVYYMLFTIF